MDRARILIAIGKAEQRSSLKLLLARGSYQVVGEAGDGQQALRQARSLSPDLVLAEVDLPGMNGFELCRVLNQDRRTPVLLISQQAFLFSQPEERTKYYPICYATKPLSEYNLFPAIESLFNCQKHIQALEAEIGNLQEKIETRKLVERAKGLLMEQLGVPEAETYRRMQKQSMDKCLSMRKVAEAIILAYDLNK
ncbi:MAG: ANTAR domain-containing protein [Thermacetogeniaceae bacterium]